MLERSLFRPAEAAAENSSSSSESSLRLIIPTDFVWSMKTLSIVILLIGCLGVRVRVLEGEAVPGTLSAAREGGGGG